MKLPHGQGVVDALRSVRVATKKTIKGLNQATAKRMARGDYAGAHHLAVRTRTAPDAAGRLPRCPP